jgi:isopenicillin N synthase-like dioxygenase
MRDQSVVDIPIEAIPVIDVGALVNGDSTATSDVGRAMRQAAETIGFFYVKNHGIAQALIDRVDQVARQFFALPDAVKREVEPTDRHRGFLKVGEAKMYAGAKIDLKESYIWGLDLAHDDADYVAGNRMHGPNRWPAQIPQMRATFNEYFQASNACGRMLLRAFAASLNISPEYFVTHFAKPVTRCSAVFYPPQLPDAGEDQFGVAPHTDFGTLTLVYQDPIGGLQVRARDGKWVIAHPIPGTLVVNVGDLLARWTNDRFKSTPHRVINRSGRERLSIAAFVDPDFETPIRSVTAAGETPRYDPVTCGEYILGRFDKAFAYRA